MMRLLVLGLLMEMERHPYDIRQTIKERNWHLTFKLQDGSLYYAVDQLRDHGYIEAAEVIPVRGDNRPDKTVYRITEEGKREFLELLHKQMEQTAFPQHPFFAAMPFLMHSDREVVKACLWGQYEACLSRIELLRDVALKKEGLLPRGSVKLIEGMIRLSQAEREWLEDVMAEAESGMLFQPRPQGI
ncbi:PadR family transcriptional regulator [Paenibacillus sp. PL2-23]|uniref:PadR family transcriptional regulator n=1 Tax=Paenibacillus sp. PL2-23 TaxID=2100729 RepID=UPI0030F78B0D